jgi:two-component system chemotaxis response regulator CheY
MGKHTLVIIDDATFMRAMIKRIVNESDDFDVIGEGENGIEAIELAKKLKPDLMTLDITMPKMDGINSIKGILKASPKTRILMISAMGQQSMMIDAIKAGARDFIVKPFEELQILEVLKKIIAD